MPHAGEEEEQSFWQTARRVFSRPSRTRARPVPPTPTPTPRPTADPAARQRALAAYTERLDEQEARQRALPVTDPLATLGAMWEKGAVESGAGILSWGISPEVRRRMAQEPSKWGFLGDVGRARRAFQATGLPSAGFEVPHPLLPGLLPNIRGQVGVKGALELAGDPANLVPGLGPAAKGARAAGPAARRGLLLPAYLAVGAVPGPGDVGKAAERVTRSLITRGGPKEFPADLVSGRYLVARPVSGYQGSDPWIVFDDLAKEADGTRKILKGGFATKREAMAYVDNLRAQATAPGVAAPSPGQVATPGPGGIGKAAGEGGEKALDAMDPVIQEFTRFLHSPESADLYAMTLEVRKRQRARRIEAYEVRSQQLLSEGRSFEEANDIALKETMSGEFDRPLTTLSETMATQFRDALFRRVHDVLADDPLERIATAEALTNALLGKGIPNLPGVKGGSAFSRLSRVFPPEVVDILKQKRRLEEEFEYRLLESLKNRPEQPYRGPPDFPPYLKIVTERPGEGLRPMEGQFPAGGQFFERLPGGERVPVQQGEIIPPDPLNPQQRPLIAEEPAPPMRPMEPSQQLSFWEQEEMRRGFARGTMPPAPGSSGLSAELPEIRATVSNQLPMLPREDQNIWVNAFKEIGMAPFDIANFIRANLTSPDWSWWRQQKATIAGNFPDFVAANVEAWQVSVVRSVQAAKELAHVRNLSDVQSVFNEIDAKSRVAAEAMERRIQNHPYYQYYAEAGYDFLRPMAKAGTKAVQREESFISIGSQRAIPRLTAWLPWVKFGERSFVTGTNEMNWRMFVKHVDRLQELEREIAQGRYSAEGWRGVNRHAKEFAKYLSDMTGRSKIGGLANVTEASQILFSPRMFWSRFMTPRHAISMDPHVRKQFWKNSFAYVGTTGGFIALGAMAGLWEVEKDLRSGTPMQIRIGPHRFDPWAGDWQLPTLVARLITGEGKSSRTGREYPVGFVDALTRYVTTKTAPGLSLLVEAGEGKTITGEKFDPLSIEQWAGRVANMTLWSAYEAAQESGMAGLLAGIPSGVGVGVSTFDYKIAELHKEWQGSIDGYLNIPSTANEAKANKLLTRQQARQKYPELDARLFITGYVDSVLSNEAGEIAVRYMKEHGLRTEDIQGLEASEKDIYLPAKQRRQNAFRKALGEVEPTPSAG